MKLLLVIVLTAALTGCAGTPQRAEKPAATTAESGTVCEQDQVTGTRFTNTRCRTAAQREQDRRNADDLDEVARRAAAVTKPGSN